MLAVQRKEWMGVCVCVCGMMTKEHRSTSVQRRNPRPKSVLGEKPATFRIMLLECMLPSIRQGRDIIRKERGRTRDQGSWSFQRN